jgi:hypothetical protein
MLAVYTPPLSPPLATGVHRPERQDIAHDRAITPLQFYTRDNEDLEYRPARDIPIPEQSREHSTCLFRDPNDRLVKLTESQGEQNCIIAFCADRSVSRIETQYMAVEYTASDGTDRFTIFDARVSYWDDFRTLVASKPRARAAKSNLIELNDLIVEQVDPAIANQAQTVTEADLPQWALANARLIQSVRNDGVWAEIDGLKDAIRLLLEPVKISDLCLPFGGTGKVFRSVAKLIFDRDLVLVEPGEIDICSLVDVPREVVRA